MYVYDHTKYISTKNEQMQKTYILSDSLFHCAFVTLSNWTQKSYPFVSSWH